MSIYNGAVRMPRCPRWQTVVTLRRRSEARNAISLPAYMYMKAAKIMSSKNKQLKKEAPHNQR
jgi:hypothetical protein